MADASSERGWVNVDRSAPFALAARLLLSPSERLLLYDLLVLVDFRQHEWMGSVTDLTSWTRQNWRTVKAAITRLESLGVLAIVEPFEHNAKGRIRVLVYEELVVPNRARGRSAALPPSLASVRFGANSQVRDSQSSTSAEPVPNEYTTGAEPEPESWDVCKVCGEPADGAPGQGGVTYCREHEEPF